MIVLSATAGVQLAKEASDKVNQIGVPIVALGVALLVLGITIAVIAYISSRLPKGG